MRVRSHGNQKQSHSLMHMCRMHEEAMMGRILSIWEYCASGPHHSACSSSSVLVPYCVELQFVILGVEAIVGLFPGMAVLWYGSLLLCTAVLQEIYIYIYKYYNWLEGF